MSTLIFIFYMFLIAMFIVYFGYMSSIVSLLLSSCICSYSAHPNMQDPWVGGRHYVSVVLRYEIPLECRLYDGTCGRSLRWQLGWVLCSPSPVYRWHGRARSRRRRRLCFQFSL